jgi:quinol monooxygenase YgiN
MPDKVAIIATLKAAEGKGNELEAAFLAAVPEVQAETGTERYIVHRSPDDADTITVYEIYTDEAAKDAHMHGDALKNLGRAMKGLLAGAPTLVTYTVAGGKGF